MHENGLWPQNAYLARQIKSCKEISLESGGGCRAGRKSREDEYDRVRVSEVYDFAETYGLTRDEDFIE